MNFKCTSDWPMVETPKGKIHGFFLNGIYNFWGVDYAKAERFHEAKEIEPWDGVKNALAYGMVPIPLSEAKPDNEMQIPHRSWVQGEDCLNLQIWTPSIQPEDKHPVLVWFHGGGHVAGSAIEHLAYEGDRLAKKYGATVVNVNHRLNVFGFLDMSDYGEEYKNSANLGIHDLVMALKWIKENISAFGGDPDCVTLFGQSGGGEKITALGQCSEAEGLFQRGVIMSGVFPEYWLQGKDDPKLITKEILRILNISEENAKHLEKVPRHLLIDAANKAIEHLGRQGILIGWGPRKSDFFKGDPLIYGFNDWFKKIPIMMGSTISEFYGFYQPSERMKESYSEEEITAQIFEKFGEEKGQALIDAFKKAYPEKGLWIAPYIDHVVRPRIFLYAKEKAKESPVYCYNFTPVYKTYDNGRSAWHCADIPFFFANIEKAPVSYEVENAEALEETIVNAFMNFARTGDPNGEKVPAWHPVTEQEVPTMCFDSECVERTGYDEELMQVVTELFPPFLFIEPPKEETDEDSIWFY